LLVILPSKLFWYEFWLLICEKYAFLLAQFELANETKRWSFSCQLVREGEFWDDFSGTSVAQTLTLLQVFFYFSIEDSASV
jgi:hypothetical protein